MRVSEVASRGGAEPLGRGMGRAAGRFSRVLDGALSSLRPWCRR
jgi:hypothetical protein